MRLKLNDRLLRCTDSRKIREYKVVKVMRFCAGIEDTTTGLIYRIPSASFISGESRITGLGGSSLYHERDRALLDLWMQENPC